MQAPVDALPGQVRAGPDQGVGEAGQMADVIGQGLAHLGGAFRARADDELDADPPVVLRRGPFQRRGEQGLEDVANRGIAGVTVGGLMQHAGAFAVQLAGAAAEDLEEQGVLGAEVIIH